MTSIVTCTPSSTISDPLFWLALTYILIISCLIFWMDRKVK